jgi:hypothetical protein
VEHYLPFLDRICVSHLVERYLDCAEPTEKYAEVHAVHCVLRRVSFVGTIFVRHAADRRGTAQQCNGKYALELHHFLSGLIPKFSDQRRQHSRPVGLPQTKRVRLPPAAPQVCVHHHVLGFVSPVHVGAGNREGPIGAGEHDGEPANYGGDGEADNEERGPRKNCSSGECNFGAILDMGGGVDAVHVRIFGQ